MKSADGGEHWSAPVTLVVEPPAEDSLLPVFPHYPSISATTGKLYVAWVCIPKGNSRISSATRRIMLMLSDNMGASWNPPMAICEDTVSIRGLEMDALGSRVSLIWPEVSTMNEYEYPANRTCYINSSDYGQTWTENRSPTGKDFKYNGDMYVGDDYNSLDLELGRTADYVVCDSTRITFVFSTKDRGWHWSKVRAIQPENEKENYGKTEFSTRDSVMAVLSCMDNKVLLEYSIDWGKTFNESMLLSKAPTNRIGDVGGTGDPRLAIDKYYRIHAVWSQILDSTAKVKAMFYYMQPTTGVVEEPVETVGRPLVFASANLFANRLDLKIVHEQDRPIYIAVYDASGRIVKNIATEGRRGSCLYWDGTDESAAMVPDGLYFIRARSGDRTELLKVIKLK